MERQFAFILVTLLFVQSSSWAAGGATAPSGKPVGARPEADVLMKCIYTPAADQQSSSLPTQKLGFKFSLERNNSNEVAVDIYSLTEDSQLLRQIGHAEMVNPSLTITTTSKASDILGDLELAEDSPFDFVFSLTGTDAGNITVMTTFTGQTYTSLAVNCKQAPQGNASK